MGLIYLLLIQVFGLLVVWMSLGCVTALCNGLCQHFRVIYICIHTHLYIYHKGSIWIIFTALRTCDLTQTVIYHIILSPVCPHRLYKIHHIDAWRRHGEIRAGSVHFSVRQHPHDAGPRSICQKLTVQIKRRNGVMWPSKQTTGKNSLGIQQRIYWTRIWTLQHI